MIYTAKVHVMLKQDVADVQGAAIEQSLKSHGYSVSNIRVGKYFEVEIDSENESDARHRLEELAKGTFSNPVIENFTLEIAEKK